MPCMLQCRQQPCRRFLVVISFQISFQASAVTFTSIQDQSAYIVQLRSCRMDNIMWLRQDLTVGTYSASLNILGGAVAILFVSLTLSLMMAIKACLKSVTSQLTEQNLQLREQRKLILKLIHRLEQGSLDVKETVISKEGVPSDHHQPQLHTLVKPEDAQRILVLSELRASLSSYRADVDPPDEELSWAKNNMISRSLLSSDACETGTSPKCKLTRQKSRSPKPHGVAAVRRTPCLASKKSMASNSPSLVRRSNNSGPSLVRRSNSSGTLFDASIVQKRIESRKQSCGHDGSGSRETSTHPSGDEGEGPSSGQRLNPRDEGTCSGQQQQDEGT